MDYDGEGDWFVKAKAKGPDGGGQNGETHTNTALGVKKGTKEQRYGKKGESKNLKGCKKIDVLQ